MTEEHIKAEAPDTDYDALAEPPNVQLSRDHPLCGKVVDAIKEVYDPEIPVNVYELGLIYAIEIKQDEDRETGEDGEDAGGIADVEIKMTLTSPGCPVAQEMPGWVQGAVLPIDGIGEVDVEIVWDPVWDPGMMAETAKMQLNMFM